MSDENAEEEHYYSRVSRERRRMFDLRLRVALPIYRDMISWAYPNSPENEPFDPTGYAVSAVEAADVLLKQLQPTEAVILPEYES